MVPPLMSLSARRAWIEISTRSQPGRPKAVALRKESVDRNFAVIVGQHQAHASLSARRAWIEIEIPHGRLCPLRSSLSARRAWIEILELSIVINSRSVALRKESVDRNRQLLQEPFLSYVALRKESVDRNTHPILLFRLPLMSLSARRAWIEIPVLSLPFGAVWVALRKESVDRNIVEIHPDGRLTWSLSARRAWIEITMTISNLQSLRGRSPQGERG